MTWPARLAAVAALLAVAGCAGPASMPASRTDPRVRCLGEPPPGAPAGATVRPLFFLFCIQSS